MREIVRQVPEGLRPLEGRARWAVGAVGVVMLVDLVVIWSDMREIALMNRLLEDGEALDSLSAEAFDDVDSNDTRQLVAASAFTVAYIAAIVFFIRWFHAAYSNLRVLGQPEIRYHTAWAIVAWFIPIFNVWRPKQITNDIWRGSDPGAPTYGRSAWKDVPVPALLGFWWAAWLVTNYISNFALRTAWEDGSLEDVKLSAQLDIAASLTDIVAGALAIPVVVQLTRRQQARAERLAARSQPLDSIPSA